ncbi:uncharacterized protein [Solanum lycopersicum]|uniref:uncharacterized protein n=1 Tax=Solanum lycopersicum TaxID=4081 RepID=UPI00374A780B
MPTHKANARNVNARNANVTPLILNQLVSNDEFRNAIQMLAMNVANRNNRVQAHVIENGGSIADRIRDFVRINKPEFFKSYTSEDLHNFLDEMKNIFEVMQVNRNDQVKFTSYQRKDVAHIRYTQWKENKVKDAPPITWDILSETFLYKFFPIDLREAKTQEFMNLRQGSMRVQEYGFKFNLLCTCSVYMVANSRA